MGGPGGVRHAKPPLDRFVAASDEVVDNPQPPKNPHLTSLRFPSDGKPVRPAPLPPTFCISANSEFFREVSVK